MTFFAFPHPARRLLLSDTTKKAGREHAPAGCIIFFIR